MRYLSICGKMVSVVLDPHIVVFVKTIVAKALYQHTKLMYLFIVKIVISIVLDPYTHIYIYIYVCVCVCV